MTECDLYRPPISLENLNDTAVLDWLNMMSDIIWARSQTKEEEQIIKNSLTRHGVKTLTNQE